MRKKSTLNILNKILAKGYTIKTDGEYIYCKSFLKPKNDISKLKDRLKSRKPEAIEIIKDYEPYMSDPIIVFALEMFDAHVCEIGGEE